MTSYGTIPTSIPGGTASTNLDFISRGKERIYDSLATRKPWGVMFSTRALGLPRHGLSDALSRVRENGAYFLNNYVIIVLLIVFLSLLWHPISLIVFIVMMFVWMIFYFERESSLLICGWTIDGRLVLAVLGILTLVFLLLTDVTLNIFVSLLIGLAFVVLHGVLRRTDDLCPDEEAATRMIASSSS